MPGLLRGIARTAVVAGTASAVANRVSRWQAGRWAEQDEQAEQEMAPPGNVPTMASQLRELGDLKNQGLLTDAEFEQQKQRLLDNQ